MDVPSELQRPYQGGLTRTLAYVSCKATTQQPASDTCSILPKNRPGPNSLFACEQAIEACSQARPKRPWGLPQAAYDDIPRAHMSCKHSAACAVVMHAPIAHQNYSLADEGTRLLALSGQVSQQQHNVCVLEYAWCSRVLTCTRGMHDGSKP